MLRQLSLRVISHNKQILKRCYCIPSATATTENVENASQGGKNISKAMKAYLERAKEHDEFMKEEQQKFQIGKRHLANMMGENPETFTQEDIDASIEYLFPSGLFEKKARPIMKPPEEIFPQRKAAEFNEQGRPHHFLFYTGLPNYYKLLYDIVDHVIDCNKIEDDMISRLKTLDRNLTLDFSGYKWISKEVLEKELVEPLSDRQYQTFLVTMERLFDLPYSYRKKDFIDKYRTTLMSQMTQFEIPKPQYDKDGRAYAETHDCRRKNARGYVKVLKPGTGKVTINGEDLRYFADFYCREQILFPLLFTDMHKSVDIEARVEGGGPSGHAGAVRWGIAWCLRSFVDQETIEKMRIAGLLTQDVRTRERKKPGQSGARRKWTWLKR